MVARHCFKRRTTKTKGGGSSDISKWPADQRVSFVLKNPKKAGSSAFERYQKYKHAKTVQEALDYGAFGGGQGDLAFDLRKGYLQRTSKGSPNAIEYVVSLGTRCFVAEVLREVGLRRFACPFDWIYSSAEMVTHCLNNNFTTFLDVTQIKKSGNAFGHKHYSHMLNRGIIYPHHNPRKCMEDFKRRVLRLKTVLSSGKRKLFIICNTIDSLSALKESKESNGTQFQDVFAALRKKRCNNFELLAVNLLTGPASEATVHSKTRAPITQKLEKQGCKAHKNVLTVYNFHCTGANTGLRFKNKNDSAALGRLFTSNHSFDLAEDPNPDNTAGSSSKKTVVPEAKKGTLLHPTRTVKRLNDGTWLSKRMD